MIILALAVLLLSVPLAYALDPDFGWHLALGRYIHQQGSLVHSLVGYNVFANQPLIDHEWLAHWLLYPVYEHFGYFPFVLMSALVLYATVVLLYKVCRKVSSRALALAASLLFLVSADLTYGVRLQDLLLLGAAMLVWVERGVADFRKRCLAYFFIFLIGNNLHGGFLVLSIIPLAFEAQRAWRAYKLGEKVAAKLIWLAVTLSVAFAINPNGLAFWRLTWDYIREPYYKQQISEWLPLYSVPIHWWYGVLPFALVVFSLLLGNYWRKLSLAEGFLILVFGYVGFTHLRFLPLFTLIALPSVAVAWQETWQKQDLEGIARRILIATGSFAWIVLAMVRINPADFAVAFQPQKAPGYPEQEANYLVAHPQECPGNLFNDYNFGGYLAGFYPQKPVFIDGRGPQLGLPDGNTLLQEYSIFMDGNPADAAAKLAQYDITCVLIAHPQPSDISELDSFLAGVTPADQARISKARRFLYDYLSKTPSWHVADDGVNATLFVKD